MTETRTQPVADISSSLSRVFAAVAELRSAMQALHAAAGPSYRAAPQAVSASPALAPSAMNLPVAGGAVIRGRVAPGHPYERMVAGSAAPSMPAIGRRTFAVRVTYLDGRVDLKRLYRMLQSIEGVSDLVLASCGSRHAVIEVATDRSPRDIPIRQALAFAYPQGASGDWVDDTEFAATVNAADTPPRR